MSPDGGRFSWDPEWMRRSAGRASWSNSHDDVKLLTEDRKSKWQMLYCGGSQPVVDALAGIERDFGVKLRVEKFDW